MLIKAVKAYPLSYVIPEEHRITLGIGTAVKRDAVLLKVITDEGIVGWGEAHHGRCPGAIAKLIDTTISELAVGMDAGDPVAVWSKVYRMQLSSHGMGTAACMALSALDMALWDVRGKACGWPLYRMLGGGKRKIKAYAGGISLGWQPDGGLVEEALRHVEKGYRALKLRVGDTPDRDIRRVRAVRDAVGDAIEILVDANTGYTVEDVRKVMPAFCELAVGWLEEPFPPHDWRSYKEAAASGPVPIAAGENLFTRFEFTRLIEDGAVRFLQPDVSKAGGVTELMRIAALGSAWKLSFNPHTLATGLNMAGSLHILSAVDNAGYFEGDVSTHNPFRDNVTNAPCVLDADGCVTATESAGLGLEVDEQFLLRHPLIEGPCYV